MIKRTETPVNRFAFILRKKQPHQFYRVTSTPASLRSGRRSRGHFTNRPAHRYHHHHRHHRHHDHHYHHYHRYRRGESPALFFSALLLPLVAAVYATAVRGLDRGGGMTYASDSETSPTVLALRRGRHSRTRHWPTKLRLASARVRNIYAARSHDTNAPVARYHHRRRHRHHDIVMRSPTSLCRAPLIMLYTRVTGYAINNCGGGGGGGSDGRFPASHYRPKTL